MLASFKELPLDNCKEPEDFDKVFQEHLGLSLATCGEAMSKFLTNRAEELVPDMINMAPYGKYDQLTEDPQVMLSFLQTEAIKPENWVLQFMEAKEGSQLMSMVFFNKSVDDGDTLKGHVIVGLSGKIRHAFVQAHN